MKQTLQQEKVALIHKKGENANQIQVYMSQIIGLKTKRKQCPATPIGDAEKTEIENQMRQIHHKKQALENENSKIIRRMGEIGKIEDQTLVSILKEIFSKDQMDELYLETRRRIDGMPSVKIVLFKEKKDEYKKIATSLAEQLLRARREMTMVFNQGCSVFDKAQFMKVVSPLNTSIQPEVEINKLRRTYNF